MDAVPPPTSYTGGPTSYPPSYGDPAGGYGGGGLSDVRSGGRGGHASGYDSGYGPGGPCHQGGGYGGHSADAPVKIKQCDDTCGDSCDNTRIYISNLPTNITVEELRDLFGGIGQEELNRSAAIKISGHGILKYTRMRKETRKVMQF
ncbi:hypothetical protein ES332_A05G116700v1 [Gossypium tomentosum]|uniref:RRM domain-containing protein n=1 Tax=Gossypium tomentosum TaxID=34277 RepID=A0A5D2QD93_GOSTO|nr:hypothetical protein ES332_A05G116700v1 [Gossypium tomentosum]